MNSVFPIRASPVHILILISHPVNGATARSDPSEGNLSENAAVATQRATTRCPSPSRNADQSKERGWARERYRGTKRNTEISLPARGVRGTRATPIYSGGKKEGLRAACKGPSGLVALELSSRDSPRGAKIFPLADFCPDSVPF